MTTVKSDAILSIEGNCHLCQIVDCNVMSWITLNWWGKKYEWTSTKRDE